MSQEPSIHELIKQTIRFSPTNWASACNIILRPYQVQIARAIKDSILHRKGLTFVVILPRQSGKNELQAHLFAWLLFRYARIGGRIVSVSPTFKPQTINNMQRVSRSLDSCVGSRHLWKSTKGYIYQFDQACLQFFSGEPRAKVVGATADLLLSVDEAQEVSIAKFDKDFDPMTASTNATRIFWGTAWTSNTLLERERRLALLAQQKDGLQRLFYFTADDVRLLVPAYGAHVDRVIAEHGRDHPRVRSQYFCETIDAQSGMFTPSRLALIIAPPLLDSPPQMRPSFGEGSGVGLGEGSGSLPQPSPRSGDMWVRVNSPPPAEEGPGVRFNSPLPPGEGAGVRAFLIDVAGMDECAVGPIRDSSQLSNPGRDSTALSIVEIDLSTLAELGHPTYHVVARHSWVGEPHLAVFGKLKSLAETWNPQHIVIDATGVGEGLWSLLNHAFPSRLIPVKFTQSEKSEVGWRFLSIIETGRFRDHVHTDQVRLQYSHCTYEILPGPQKTLRWGVPDGTRGPQGELIHDDFILADSLISRLDLLEWRLSTPPMVVSLPDPLSDRNYFDNDSDYDHFFGSRAYDRPFWR